MSIDAQETGLRRGLVLLALHEQYPAALRHPALWGRLRLAYGDDDRALTRDIAYLGEIKLLVEDSLTLSGQRLVAYRLTAEGVDVVEGARPCPGVLIERGGRR